MGAVLASINRYAGYELMLFSIAIFLEGIANLVFSYVVLGGLKGLIIAYGVFDFILATIIATYYRQPQSLSSDLSSSKSLALLFVFSLMNILIGVEFAVLRAYTIGVLLILAVIMWLISYLMYTRLNVSRMVLGVMVMLSAIFLSISGFMGSIVTALIHLGVASIALYILAIVTIASAVTEISGGLRSLLHNSVLLIFSVALLVGAAFTLWIHAGRVNFGGVYAASSGVGIISSVLVIIVGVLAIISSIVNLTSNIKTSGSTLGKGLKQD